MYRNNSKLRTHKITIDTYTVANTKCKQSKKKTKPKININNRFKDTAHKESKDRIYITQVTTKTYAIMKCLTWMILTQQYYNSFL